MLNRKKNIFFLLFVVFSFHIGICFAQAPISPPLRQVIGSSGNFSVGTIAGLSLSYTVGEPVTETFEPGVALKLLQGFQQPSAFGVAGFSITTISANASCKGANNGNAIITATSIIAPPLTFAWLPNTVDPINTSSTSTIRNLSPGVYYYTVTDAGGFSVSDSIVILDSPIECGTLLTVWTGVTPNGDDKNDTWTIDGIEFFPDNRVRIFNRWGDLVWTGEKYDNAIVSWKGQNQGGQQLPSGTYFYVILIPDRKTEKGWVELTR